ATLLKLFEMGIPEMYDIFVYETRMLYRSLLFCMQRINGRVATNTVVQEVSCAVHTPCGRKYIKTPLQLHLYFLQEMYVHCCRRH
ncbi:hypothetical protein L9F63_026239, partial [Diploptera punctata]